MRATTSCALLITSVLAPCEAVTSNDALPGARDKVAPVFGADENDIDMGTLAPGVVLSAHAAMLAVAARKQKDW